MLTTEITRKIALDSLKLELLQRAMEQDAHRRAQKRATERAQKLVEKGREGDGNAADAMINWSIADVIQRVRAWIDHTQGEAKKGRPSHEQRLLPIYSALAEDLGEFVSGGLGSCFNGITRGVSLTKTAFDIGRRAEHILMMREVRNHDKKLFARMVSRMKEKGEESKRADTLSFTMRVNDIEWDGWPEHIKLALGVHFIHLVMDVTGYFEIQNVMENKKTVQMLALTQEAARKLNNGQLQLIQNATLYEPMIVPPVNWKEGVVTGAGYLTNVQRPLALVKTNSRKYLRDLAHLKDDRLSTFYRGLEGAQGTGWRIRASILDLIGQMRLVGNDMGVLPPLKLAEGAVAPFCADEASKILERWDASMGNRRDWIATLPMKEQIAVNEFLEWKATEARRHKANVELQGRWVGLARNLATAHRLKHYDSIYLPYQVDFRCRVYAVTQGGLSPQGEDYIKALLELDTALPLGERGWWWLRWHTANVWGEDKACHDDRVKWADEHMDMIRACAEDPLNNREWTDADKPFQFLACCFELNEAMKGNPFEFESRIPIALDGSCSGLQHLGMATRCTSTGHAVNLIAGEKPSDIYQIVADKVARDLRALVSGGLTCKKEEWLEHAQKWLDWAPAWKNGKLSRNVTKRSVMTFPYGSAEYGFGEQVMEDTLKPAYDAAGVRAGEMGVPLSELFPWPDFKSLNHAARLMAWLIWRAVNETVKIPAQIMQWLQQMARLVAKSNAPVKWTTPLGFPVVQSYYKQDSRTIDSVLYGKKRVQVRYRVETRELDAHRQVNGIAPNVVHSLDSTHLLMTVAAAMDEGIKHFALIHDSFGTHAANTDKLFRIVREQMVKLYSGDYFNGLKQELTALVPMEYRDQIPDLPVYGDMDIECLLDSPYAFS
ncbi:DNA-directed RNA polymerase [Aeromonas enteropelogenes]|uniref:DNA-directed RNA polymerase n=1 Tax=Aeromonas enteropelogenes TaxID=29489 RepID=UPI001CBEBFF6|nr:DNA-directed RNA polymerase [Aeromonas enteropelogenes]UAK70957.1 hypothetical protein K8O95_14920 [Aeromonas enteropelogenes]